MIILGLLISKEDTEKFCMDRNFLVEPLVTNHEKLKP